MILTLIILLTYVITYFIIKFLYKHENYYSDEIPLPMFVYLLCLIPIINILICLLPLLFNGIPGVPNLKETLDNHFRGKKK